MLWNGELSSKSVQILKRVFQSKSVKAISVRDNLIKFQDEFHLHDVIQTADPALNCARVYSVKRKHNIYDYCRYLPYIRWTYIVTKQKARLIAEFFYALIVNYKHLYS